MSNEELLKVRNECTQFLHGHLQISPKKYFSQMDEYTCQSEQKDHYGRGVSLQRFESELSELFGFEDCLFLQSGTMAQLIAMRIWTDNKNNPQIAFHPTCHLEIHEHKAYKELHKLNSELIGSKDRLINLDDLKNIKSNPAVVIFELPQREIGSQLPEWKDLKQQIEYLKAKNIIVHLDGARVWECTTYYGKSLKEIASLFDSVYVSFYKGVGAIAGAALLGSNSFISESRIWNRRHGGNLITMSPLYLSAQFNLEKRINSFTSYYLKTLEIAKLASEIKGLELLPKVPQVNMFHLLIKGDLDTLKKRALKIAKKTKVWGLMHLQTSEQVGFCKLEWYVGDAALQVSTATIKEVLTMIVSDN